MTLIIVKIYPDYMSSGMWIGSDKETSFLGAELDASRLEGVLPSSILIALKYWHATWELAIDPFDIEVQNLHSLFTNSWNEDGQTIVNLMNEYHQNKEYEFVYVDFRK